MDRYAVLQPQVDRLTCANTSTRWHSQAPDEPTRAPFATQSATHFDLVPGLIGVSSRKDTVGRQAVSQRPSLGGAAQLGLPSASNPMAASVMWGRSPRLRPHMTVGLRWPPRRTPTASCGGDQAPGRAGLASCASRRASCLNQAPAAGSSTPHSGSNSAWSAAVVGHPGWV
jgi:hypothetical protein